MRERDGRWVEVGDRVLVRRYLELDLSVGLVLGDGGALVVDAGGDELQGAELAAAVRELTPDPWTVVLTHAHFDHVLGTAAFLPAPVWAQRGALDWLRPGADLGRAEFVQRYRAEGREELAAALSAARVVRPDRVVARQATLDVGGRRVSLHYFGPGHTDHDLVVSVQDSGVLFAGDLVEHGASGSFTADSFGAGTVLAAWPDTLTGILDLDPRLVVAGHGQPVDQEFVISARAALYRLVAARAEVRAGEIGLVEAVTRCALPAEVVRAALATVDESITTQRSDIRPNG